VHLKQKFTLTLDKKTPANSTHEKRSQSRNKSTSFDKL